jgi:hypothetical protein
VFGLFVFFCGIPELSLVILSTRIQNEARAQVEGPSGYEFVTKWGSQGQGPGQFDGQNDIVPLEESFAIVPDYGNNRLQKFSDNGTFVAHLNTTAI